MPHATSRPQAGALVAFRFDRGNVSRVATLPLLVLGQLLTRVVPRTRGSWVFGCGSGVGEGALALAQLVQREHPEVDITWLTGSGSEDAAAAVVGLRHRRRSSLGGLLATARAEVIVFTHGFGDVNRYAANGAYVVQLWHGVPLKRIQLDSPVSLQLPGMSTPHSVQRMLATAYRRQTSRIALFPAASERVAARLRSAFGVGRAKVLVTGDPRDDCLAFTPDRDARACARLAVAVPGLPAGLVILYAPTWRDGAADPAIPSPADWPVIIDLLERIGATLLIRSHPHGSGDYAAGVQRSDRIRLLTPVDLVDVTTILPAVDQLVTDFSSIAVDFALLARPIHFLAPDAAAYVAARGLYDHYPTIAGTYARSWPALVGMLGAATNDPATRAAKVTASRRLVIRFIRFSDGRSSERVLAAILHGIGADVPGRPRVVEPPQPAPTLTLVRDTGSRLVLSGHYCVYMPVTAVLRREHYRSAVATHDSTQASPEDRSIEGEIEGEVVVDGPTWAVTFALVNDRWGDADGLPSGSYEVVLQGPDGEDAGVEVRAELPATVRDGNARRRYRSDRGTLVVEVGPARAR